MLFSICLARVSLGFILSIRRLLFRLHPDKLPEASASAAEEFGRVQHAFRVLEQRYKEHKSLLRPAAAEVRCDATGSGRAASGLTHMYLGVRVRKRPQAGHSRRDEDQEGPLMKARWEVYRRWRMKQATGDALNRYGRRIFAHVVILTLC